MAVSRTHQIMILGLVRKRLRLSMESFILGHFLPDNIYNFSSTKCFGDFNRHCNMFLAEFKNTSPHI